MAEGVLLLGEDVWRLGMTGEGGVAGVSWREAAVDGSSAEAVLERLFEGAGDVDRVVVSLASSWCLVARVSTEGLDRSRRSAELLYRLEEVLPVSAEEIEADFVHHDGWSLGVCCVVKRVSGVLSWLEARGISAPHLVPASLLVGDALRSREVGSAVLAEPAVEGWGVDVLSWSGEGSLAGWRWLGGDWEAARSAVAAVSDKGRAVVVVGCSAGDVGLDEAGVVKGGGSYLDLLLAGARSLLSEPSVAAVELRRGSLAAKDWFVSYRGPVVSVVVAAVLLMLSVAGVSVWRGQAYALEAERLRGEQERAFAEAFPGQRVPVSIVSRLESESRRLAGVSGRGEGGAGDEALREASALDRLYGVLSSLPMDLRFRVLSLRVGPDRVTVGGEARSHGDAEQLVRALRSGGVFEVDPPRTQTRSEGGVTYSFEARVGEGG